MKQEVGCVEAKGWQSSFPLAVPVLVQCGNSRLLAYRDEQGVWRCFPSREPVRGAVKRIPYGG